MTSKQKQQQAKDKKLLANALAALGTASPAAGDSATPPPPQLLSQDQDGRRFRAARQGYPSRQDEEKAKVPNPGSGSCQRCRGEHPECTSCPNGEAAKDDSFDAALWTREKRPCWYAHLGANPCGGYGHQAKHHAPLYTEAAKKAVEEKAAQREKGKGKKGKGKRQG